MSFDSFLVFGLIAGFLIGIFLELILTYIQNKTEERHKLYFSNISYLIIIVAFVCAFAMFFVKSKQLYMFLYISMLGFLYVMFISSKFKKAFIGEVLLLALILTDGIAIFAPFFFSFMGFTVTNTGNSTVTISASESINYMLTSILTVFIGYLLSNMKKE